MKRKIRFAILITLICLSSCENHDANNPSGSGLNFQKSDLLNTETEITPEISENDSIIFPGYSVITIALIADGSFWFYGLRNSVSDTTGCLVHYINNRAFLYTFPEYNDQVPFIKHISPGQNGHAYFSGFKGLVEFDGEGFHCYKSDDSALADLSLICVNIDKEQNIWFSYNDVEIGGIIKTDLSEWLYYSTENSPMPNRLIRNIEVDADNYIWLSANDYVGDAAIIKVGRGNWEVFPQRYYHIFDMSLNQQGHVFTFIDYSLSSSVLSGDTPLVIDYDGNEWKTVATCGGYPFDIDCPFLLITSSASDPSGNLWLSTTGSGSGANLYRYNGSKWQIYEANAQSVFDIAVISDSQFLLGTSGGIHKFRP